MYRIQAHGDLFVKLFDRNYLQLHKKEALEFVERNNAENYKSILEGYFPSMKFEIVTLRVEVIK